MIKLTNDLILDILEKNLALNRTDHPVVGDCILMDSYEAYIFSIITSYPYLNEKGIDGATQFPRTLYQVFNQAEEYTMQNGLFDIHTMMPTYNTNHDFKKYPFIRMNKEKCISIIDYSNLRDYKEKKTLLIRKLRRENYTETDFLIIPKFQSKNNPRDFESFFEYIVSRKFNSMNYITDTQIPFYYGIGTPDIAAYKIPKLQNELKKSNLHNTGFSIIELMTIRRFFDKSIKQYQEILGKDAIVFEVKSNQRQARSQILKYLRMRVFNEAFEVIPVEKNTDNFVGLITLSSTGELIFQRKEGKIRYDKNKRDKYLEWISNYIKCYYLINLEAEELELVFENYGFKLTEYNFVKLIKRIQISEVMDIVQKHLL